MKRSLSPSEERKEPSSVPQVVSSSSSLHALSEAFPLGASSLLDFELDVVDKVPAEGENSKNWGTSTTSGPSSNAQSSLMQLPNAKEPVLRTSQGRIVKLPSAPKPGTPIPEFLYQLTRMLTDNNREIIEWTNDRIAVHNPRKLETHVLQRYFRHSKFASFQRQLNYFGFRKLAGKGKMAPCSYVNDTAKGDVGCLLLVKRKVSAAPPKEKSKPSKADCRKVAHPPSTVAAHRGAAVANLPSRTSSTGPSPKDIAKNAVGKGVRHGYTAADCRRVEPRTATVNPSDPISQLAASYNFALSDTKDDLGPTFLTGSTATLDDLAVILEPAPMPKEGSSSFVFVDFPNPEVAPAAEASLDEKQPDDQVGS